ncbi:MAG: radical SAM protein [Chloroflexi bacterium]|nr:radical SAM protein [Chloroflexota bacterium]
MEIFSIPAEDKLILYRPLLRLACVGNRAMADLVLRLARQQESFSDTGVPPPEEVMTFLRTIGFLKPDPSPPPPPDLSYRPTTAVLLLTNRCNLRCTYCYASGGEGTVQDLPSELARVAIDHACQNARELGRPHFELTFHGGGEPVQAWEVLCKATAYARSKDLPCRISMVTNGVWTAHQREWILHNLDELSISFDGAQETQDRQRPFASGWGSFKAVMRTIEALDKARFSYGIRMTATVPWRGRLPEDVRFICEETGCRVMQVEPAFNIRRGEHQGPTQEESETFADAFMDAFETAHRAGRRLTYSGARPWLLTRTFCTAPYAALIVNATGRLVTCYEIASESHLLAEMSTVGRVVGSQITVDNQARDALLTCLEEKRATCRECFCYWHCAGDCYPRSLASEASTPEGLSPRCYMNREITARILLWYIMAGDGIWRGQGAHPQEAQLLRTF